MSINSQNLLTAIPNTLRAELINAYSNIAGVVCVDVTSLNAELLAPGTHAGRLTVWTKSAIDALGKNNLYM